MPALIGPRGARLAALLLSLLGARPASAAPPCGLEVLGARATYSQPPPRRGPPGDLETQTVSVEVEVRSTASVAVGRVELAVFLGARLADIDATRLAALPTLRPRALDGGGIAFRFGAEGAVPPGARRTLTLEALELSVAHEPGLVAARIAGCQALPSTPLPSPAVGGRPRASSPPAAPLFPLAALGALGLVVLVFVRRRRRARRAGLPGG